MRWAPNEQEAQLIDDAARVLAGRIERDVTSVRLDLLEALQRPSKLMMDNLGLLVPGANLTPGELRARALALLAPLADQPP